MTIVALPVDSTTISVEETPYFYYDGTCYGDGPEMCVLWCQHSLPGI
jgi:hypothetical protein